MITNITTAIICDFASTVALARAFEIKTVAPVKTRQSVGASGWKNGRLGTCV